MFLDGWMCVCTDGWTDEGQTPGSLLYPRSFRSEDKKVQAIMITKKLAENAVLYEIKRR